MEPQLENPSSRISFANEPKLSEYEVQKDFNERRIALVPHIKDFVSTHERFVDKEVRITFSEKGVSSLVSILETSDEKLVLKIPLSLAFAEGEDLFLKTWAEAGVKVPDVIEAGKLNGHSYILYTFVDAQVLDDVYTHEEKIDQGIYLEMGKTLRRMHEPEAHGYGRVVGGEAEFQSFEEWLSSPDMQKKIDYVIGNGLISDAHGSFDVACGVLKDFVSKNKKSSYCHDDFGALNIFATAPITVFDPNPKFNHGYLDLGKTIVNQLKYGLFPKELVEAYFGDESCDERALHASVFVNACMKLPYQHKKNKPEIVRNIQEYLIKNKHLLHSI